MKTVMDATTRTYLCFQSHFSVKKAAITLGIGTDNVIAVECDDVGRMKISGLRKAIKHAEDNVNLHDCHN